MSPERARRSLLAAACVAAPVAGLVAALAIPSLRTTESAELSAVAAHPGRFYVYAIFILLSGYLLIPAVFALMDLIRPSRPGWALVAGVIAQTGMLVAVGDAAVELMFWQMGQPGADHGQMTALADRYDAAAGASLVYTIGGLATLVGVVMLGVLLWRTRAVPAWAAAAVPVGAVANVVGFSIGSQALLAGSYLILLVGFLPAAVALRAGSRDVVLPAGAGSEWVPSAGA
jgi:hypothetical protein